MLHPEVDFVLDCLSEVVDTSVAPLRRVDRDESVLYDGDGGVPDMRTPIKKRKGDLKKANYVAATFNGNADRTPLGVDGGDVVQPTVSVRIEGYTSRGYGWIDPENVDGVPWDTLVENVKQAIRDQQYDPDVEDYDVDAVRLYLENESDSSHLWSDYYLATFDVRFVGSDCP